MASNNKRDPDPRTQVSFSIRILDHAPHHDSNTIPDPDVVEIYNTGIHYDTVCPGSSDSILYCKLLYKKGHYFLDIQYMCNVYNPFYGRTKDWTNVLLFWTTADSFIICL